MAWKTGQWMDDKHHISEYIISLFGARNRRQEHGAHLLAHRGSALHTNGGRANNITKYARNRLCGHHNRRRHARGNKR